MEVCVCEREREEREKREREREREREFVLLNFFFFLLFCSGNTKLLCDTVSPPHCVLYDAYSMTVLIAVVE